MVVVMAPGATDEDIAAVVARVEAVGGEAFVSKGLVRTIIGLVGDIDSFHGLNLRTLPGVAEVVRISTPFKLVSRQHHPEMSTVYVGDTRVPIGPDTFTLIAGPCAVETAGQTLAAAILTHHCGEGWAGYLEKVQASLPTVHDVRTLTAPRPVSEELSAYWTAFSAATKEDPLRLAFQTATQEGLQPRIDGLLFTHMMRYGKRGAHGWQLASLASMTIRGYLPAYALPAAYRLKTLFRTLHGAVSPPAKRTTGICQTEK